MLESKANQAPPGKRKKVSPVREKEKEIETLRSEAAPSDTSLTGTPCKSSRETDPDDNKEEERSDAPMDDNGNETHVGVESEYYDYSDHSV